MKLKEVKKIIHLQTLQRIQDNYSVALGIPISIRDTNGELLTKFSNASSLWKKIQTHPEMEGKLQLILQQAIDKCHRTGQIVIFERVPDAYTFLAPIHINGQIVAFFVGGLVRLGNPNMVIATEQANLLGIDLDEYLDIFLNLPFITRERLEASANLIKIIGNTISTLEMEDHEIQQKNAQLSLNLNKTHQELTNSLDRYKLIFDTVNDGIYAANLEDGTIIEINQVGAQILGYPSADILKGRELKEFYSNPQDREKFNKVLKEKGTIKNWIAHVVTKFGEAKILETNANLIIDKNTGKSIIHGVFREINPREHRPIID